MQVPIGLKLFFNGVGGLISSSPPKYELNKKQLLIKIVTNSVQLFIGFCLKQLSFFIIYVISKFYYTMYVLRKTQLNLNIQDMRQVSKIKLEISILWLAQ